MGNLSEEFLLPIEEQVANNIQNAIKFTQTELKRLQQFFIAEIDRLEEILKERVNEIHGLADQHETNEEQLEEKLEKQQWLDQFIEKLNNILELKEKEVINMSKLDQAIAEKNIFGLKNLLKAYLTGDPTDFNAISNKVFKKLAKKTGLIYGNIMTEKLNTSSKESWDEDYFVDLQVDLRMNFSKERFLHMLEVGKGIFDSSKTNGLRGSAF